MLAQNNRGMQDVGHPEKEDEPPTEIFRRLARNYAAQRRRHAFPSGCFNEAKNLKWVSAKTPEAELTAPTRPLLTDGELSAIAGHPVLCMQLDRMPLAPRHTGEKLSAKAARADWLHTKKFLIGKISPELWEQIETPRRFLRQKTGSYLGAESVNMDFLREPQFGKPPPLPPGHELADFRLPSYWPHERRPHDPCDISIIRLYPTNFSTAIVWGSIHNLPPTLPLQMPDSRDIRLIVQLHELRHTFQPNGYPDKNASFFAEYDADWYAMKAGARLSLPAGCLTAFIATRCLISFTSSASLLQPHYAVVPTLLAAQNSDTSERRLTDPALKKKITHDMTRPDKEAPLTANEVENYDGYKAWPLSKASAHLRELRMHVDMMLVGEDVNVTAAEIHAIATRNDKLFKPYEGRKEEVLRQIRRARLAEARTDKKAYLRVEARLLALKKIWNNLSIPLDPETRMIAGQTLEAAALFWPDIKDPKVKLAATHLNAFRPRKRPAPKAE